MWHDSFISGNKGLLVGFDLVVGVCAMYVDERSFA